MPIVKHLNREEELLLLVRELCCVGEEKEPLQLSNLQRMASRY